MLLKYELNQANGNNKSAIPFFQNGTLKNVLQN